MAQYERACRCRQWARHAQQGLPSCTEMTCMCLVATTGPDASIVQRSGPSPSLQQPLQACQWCETTRLPAYSRSSCLKAFAAADQSPSALLSVYISSVKRSCRIEFFWLNTVSSALSTNYGCSHKPTLVDLSTASHLRHYV